MPWWLCLGKPSNRFMGEAHSFSFFFVTFFFAGGLSEILIHTAFHKIDSYLGLIIFVLLKGSGHGQCSGATRQEYL